MNKAMAGTFAQFGTRPSPEPRDLREEALADPTLPEPLRQALLTHSHLERITLDAEGRFWHEGAPIDNPRISELFHRSIERTPGGTFLLHVGPFTYPIEVRDTPYFVQKVTVEKKTSQVHIELSDGSAEELDLESLRYVKDRGFYCRVKNGTFSARFSRPAYYTLAEFVEEEGEDPVLVLGLRRSILATKP